MLNVIKLNVGMLNAIMLNVIKLNVSTLNAIMLNVILPGVYMMCPACPVCPKLSFCLVQIILSVIFIVKLDVNMLHFHDECHYDEYRYAEWHYAECHFAECRL
jgi:hypothetical protein